MLVHKPSQLGHCSLTGNERQTKKTSHPKFPKIVADGGVDAETDLHTFWSCPANACIEDECVTNTQELITQAESGADIYPCLWLRGILPAFLTYIATEYLPHDETLITHVEKIVIPDETKWTSGTYYGDSSGGVHTDHKILRRVGCSVVSCDSSGNLKYGSHFNLPGIIQTVARGELFALVQLIRMIEPLSDIEFVTDDLGVNTCFNKGPAHTQKSRNVDLFNELFKLTIDKRIKLNVRWMPSHLKDEDPLPADVSRLDVLCSRHADHYAGVAAAEFQLDNSITAPVLKYSLLISP